MPSTFSRRWLCAAALAVVVVLAPAMRVAGQTAEELQRELNAMKQQFDELQKRMKKQEELIEKLSKQQVPATPPAAAAAAAAATPEAAPASVEQQKDLEKRVTESVMREVQPALAAANKTFPSQFNPAIGLVLDNVASYRGTQGANFEFRSGEIGIAASVDPYARGYAIFNGNEEGVDVEEAAIVTTSLPYNLTLTGGRFFADFGRLSKFHDHDLPFVNRPIVLDEFVGGESQADGIQLSYLTPLDQYVTLTAGAYNKIGAANFQVDNLVPRNFSQFTYLFRPATFFSLNDANSIDLGATFAYTPKVDTYTIDGLEVGDAKPRDLAGIDLTYRYVPLSQASYHGLTWGTEVLYNHETFNDGTAEDPLFRPTDAWGMYSYAEAKLSRVFYPGFLFQYTQAISREQGNTASYSPYLTMWASEFQRIRLQYTYLDAPQDHESEFFAQWTVILGSHVHGFRDR